MRPLGGASAFRRDRALGVELRESSRRIVPFLAQFVPERLVARFLAERRKQLKPHLAGLDLAVEREPEPFCIDVDSAPLDRIPPSPKGTKHGGGFNE